MGKKRTLCITGLALIVLCAVVYLVWQRNRICSKQIFAMDTVMTFTAYGAGSEEAVDAAIAEIQRLDLLLSTGDPNSEVSQINAQGSGSMSEDTAALARAALDVFNSTNGFFDFTIYPLMQLWGFPTGDYHIPTQAELAVVLPLVDASKVSLDGTSITLGSGQQIDFGGIAKGYASARAMAVFQEHGIVSGMVSLGGNIQVLGRKPDGSPWRIGIQDPDASHGTPLAVLEVDGQAVITSGGYERYFEVDGSRYIHILNPHTGLPAESGLRSVTVVSEDGTLADALSTSLYLMGLEEAISYWRASGGGFDLILLSDEGEILVTEGISGSFQSELPVTVVPYIRS